MPATVSIAETLTAQQLLHTFTLTPKHGLFVCLIVSVLPENTEGKPFFLLKTGPTGKNFKLGQ